jgi:simple sugar transport system permease protein
VFVIALSDVDKLRAGDVEGILTTIKDAYLALPNGAFNGWRAINETIVATTPLLLAGLAVAITFRAGLFNIGGTGQMLMGGMGAIYVGFSMDGPGFIQIPLGVLAGMVMGMAWGIIPGLLKARAGVHEVIATIMLNFIAGSLVLWLLKTDMFGREGRNDPISKFNYLDSSDSLTVPNYARTSGSSSPSRQQRSFGGCLNGQPLVSRFARRVLTLMRLDMQA